MTYKIISKLLTNRLKVVLPKLISPYQLAFLPGRLIQDNYIVTGKVFNSMNHKRGKGEWMEIKADREKAYDKVEWEFVIALSSF